MKQGKRIKDSDAVRSRMLRDPTCVGCEGPACEGHHIVERSAPFFGDDVEENIAPLCLFCHREHHDGNADVSRAIGLGLTDENILYVFSRLGIDRGREYLLRYYGLHSIEIDCRLRARVGPSR